MTMDEAHANIPIHGKDALLNKLKLNLRGLTVKLQKKSSQVSTARSHLESVTEMAPSTYRPISSRLMQQLQ